MGGGCEAMSEEAKEYKGIFKSTFLFSFVQVVRLLAALFAIKLQLSYLALQEWE